ATPLTSHLNKPTLGTQPYIAPEPTEEELAYSNLPVAPKKSIPNSVKVVAAIVLVIIVIVLSLFIVGRTRENAQIALFNEMILLAAKEGTTAVPVNKAKLDLLLTNASDPTGKKDRSAIYTALALAIASDNTDVDAEIAEYITTKEMHRDIRVVLFREVMAKRKNPKVVSTLVDFAKSATEPQTAIAAVEACREVASDSHFQIFLDLMKNSKDDSMRKAAENNITAIINKSSSSSLFRTSLVTAYNSSTNDSVKHATLRLLGRVGGDQALDFVRESLKSGDHKTKVAALGALGNWVDSDGFKILIEYIATETNVGNRNLAYNAAIKYAAATEDKPEDAWKKIAEQTKTPNDEIDLINALASYSADPWVFEIMNKIATTSKNPASVDRAKKAITYLEKMKKDQSENPEKDK
ncbi:MAG: HEAT repeat domain-containing protein, partial [Verrucomicrobiota bacterium]